MTTPRRPRAFATLLAVALVTAVGACGDDGDSEPSVPDDAVAVVGEQQVSKQEFDARVDALRRAQPARGQAERGAKDPATRKQLERQLRTQALSLLLLTAALEQEAAERGVVATTGEARERWKSVAARQFPTRRALRRFLGGQSEADAIEQLRLQMLSERMHIQVSEQAGGGPAGQRAVQRFQREFRQRWQEQTACGDGVDAIGCPGTTDG